MTLSLASYLVWFVVLIVALVTMVRGGRVLALVGAVMAWGLVAATIGMEERVYAVTSWRFLGFMALGLAGIVLFISAILRGRATAGR